MKINDFHLSYCSNIHPGESWEATFENLKKYIPEVRQRLGVEGAFGIGLRLSNEASLVLKEEGNLKEFMGWMDSENAYVFTLNGFPYGDFHRQVVKEKVHFPDWTTTDRRDYTIRSFSILSRLLPYGMDGGISTSPISYRHWFKTESEFSEAMETATLHLLEVVEELVKIRKETGKNLHLDIEPEPDGILENSDEMIWLFTDWLLPKGKPYLAKRFGITEEEAELVLKNHIQVCYDVCHFAIVYERPADTFAKFEKEGIKIGKIQISAALKLILPGEFSSREGLREKLQPFAESTYLHQVVGRNSDGSLHSYSDLPQALEKLNDCGEEEWRIHFHVPVFLDNYGSFSSTQREILSVLEHLKDNQELTNHLEVETYTWEVLPEDTRLGLGESISRELDWVIQNLSR
ncbi:metabolite traffic protein EboE [Algoriphagus sp. CAU 1675]|uniref:metabolite traffic protein EboE n=1 Tax=Algoriphagus sp. CAU 1675 TaxID=3032597 RepID=UPI0023DCA863|nr:metabolite traffic protein EboE [Algoriphagus sp. CAU 1675]MDF2156728.1 metabolite traffic protein EboE [Algoriphagus sp. CAU 1675]